LADRAAEVTRSEEPSFKTFRDKAGAISENAVSDRSERVRSKDPRITSGDITAGARIYMAYFWQG
jgi:hypothetical protein